MQPCNKYSMLIHKIIILNGDENIIAGDGKNKNDNGVAADAEKNCFK